MIAGEVGIAKALQRDIVAALNRGMALLPKAQPNTNNTKFGCNAEHTVYWANLTNFYPKNGTYNNYGGRKRMTSGRWGVPYRAGGSTQLMPFTNPATDCVCGLAAARHPNSVPAARFAHVAKVANKLLFVAPPTNSTDAQNATMGQRCEAALACSVTRIQ